MRYNEAVQAYNTQRRSFPANITAGIFGFKEHPLFQAPEAAKQVPKVDFSRPRTRQKAEGKRQNKASREVEALAFAFCLCLVPSAFRVLCLLFPFQPLVPARHPIPCRWTTSSLQPAEMQPPSSGCTAPMCRGCTGSHAAWRARTPPTS